jgi:protein-S-isoprenylcysteine O-methyltransferase Ste14
VTDSAGVLAPPPVLFVGAWTIAAVLHRMRPVKIARAAPAPTRLLGAVMIGIGLCLSGTVVRWFAHASTPVSPLRATRALVIDGPYRYSRNPDYLGQTLVYAGASLLRNRLWPLLLLPAAVALVTHAVIEREERYLGRLFGATYQSYAERVPRWL